MAQSPAAVTIAASSEAALSCTLKWMLLRTQAACPPLPIAARFSTRPCRPATCAAALRCFMDPPDCHRRKPHLPRPGRICPFARRPSHHRRRSAVRAFDGRLHRRASRSLERRHRNLGKHRYSSGFILPADFLAGALRFGFTAAFFSVLSRHAASKAPCSSASFAAASRIWVAPPRPQPPGTGKKTSGSPSTKSRCCSGVSIRFPNPCFSAASVAKILPPTRKSAAPKCELSSAPEKLNAMRLKSAALGIPVIIGPSHRACAHIQLA